MENQDVFDKEYNIALQKVMSYFDGKNINGATMYISDTEELQSMMMLVCHNYKLNYHRTEKERTYADIPGE